MAEEGFFLEALMLSGFRAYLEPKAFDFSSKQNLAVFAPNRSGKWSIIDALEFMFSEEGTLERLGIRTINNQAGVAALAHYLAADRQIDSKVGIKFRRGRETFEGTRSTGGARPRPDVATAVDAHFLADPIIRGHSLRRFVEERTAEDRYADIAGWLQLSPLVTLQRNLRSLRQQVKASAEDLSDLKRVDVQLGKETAGAVARWDDLAVLAFINEQLIGSLDPKLILTSIDRADRGFLILAERAKIEEQQIGLAGLRQIKRTASALYEQQGEAESPNAEVGGLIPELESAVQAQQDALSMEAREREKAANALFADLWEAAEPIFRDGVQALETCPLCGTPISDTRLASVEGIHEHIELHLAQLQDYAAAKKNLDEAVANVGEVKAKTIAGLQALLPLLSSVDAKAESELAGYLAALESWTVGDLPDSQSVVTALRNLTTVLATDIGKIESEQGERTYSKARAKVERLVELKEERLLAEKITAELTALSGALTNQATVVSAAIRQKVEALLNTLRIPTNEIYRAIQGNEAIPIRIELPPEEDLNQQRLNLLIDFAPSREGVPPAGYLSDSEIHSLALALRLAAIREFNVGAPVVALDDIVTSYDADHRRSIAAMLAMVFSESQIIVVTHDERFFAYLKDQLAGRDWQFLRILKLDRDFGPRFAEHRVTDDMIEARWNAGESAANQMRQAEEEWLLGICREFGVSIRIRTVENAHSYDRSELASALASFLNGAGITPPPVPGVNNRFLASLQQGVVENFGSHFRDAPYGDGSIGDERTRWDEFKLFRDQFVCPKCGRKRFKRPVGINKPVCAHEGCESQVAFGKS